MRSVLVIAQRFPPADGDDARWVASLVRDLPQHGWRATVLTKPIQTGLLGSTRPDWATLAEVSRHADVVRIPSPEVLRLTPAVDRFVRNTRTWTPGALVVAAFLQRGTRFDAVFAVAPPYSSIGLAHLAGRLFGRPYVIALRSGWRPTPGSRAARELDRRPPRALSRAARVFHVETPPSTPSVASSLDAAIRAP